MRSNIDSLPFSQQCKDRLTMLVSMLLAEVSDVSCIVLFGGYARFEQKATSDLDILAITTEKSSRDVRGELCSRFEELGSDLIFYTTEEFQSSDCLLVEQIKKDGVLLWGK